MGNFSIDFVILKDIIFIEVEKNLYLIGVSNFEKKKRLNGVKIIENKK